MVSPYLELPLRTEAEALAERIYNVELRRPGPGHSFGEAPEWKRRVAFSKARTALAKEQRA